MESCPYMMAEPIIRRPGVATARPAASGASPGAGRAKATPGLQPEAAPAKSKTPLFIGLGAAAAIGIGAFVLQAGNLVRVTWTSPQGDVATDVQRVFPPAQLARLRHGLSLDGEPLKPAKVEWQNPEQLRFVLTEGKKRQIRRMCELVGLKVVGLKRIRIGRVTLGNLPVGQWRYLGPHERF